MPAILPNYEYDIFISYRQNDNKRDGWVTSFVAALKDELEATLKNPVSIYFDENPHDGLLETHQVNASLEKKLKCLVFIPIISQTYCDTTSFAWEHEFLPFLEMAKKDELGMNITLGSGNVTSRVLPIKIHELDTNDEQILESILDGPLRSIDFTYSEPGVNRPLKQEDTKADNLNKTNYHNQINKVANALKEIHYALGAQGSSNEKTVTGNKPFGPSQERTRKKSLKLVYTLILLPLVIGLLYFLSIYHSDTNYSEEKIDNSIAVLPFANMSNDAEQEYFSDGLSEELLNTLARIEGIQVAGRTSSFSFKGGNETLKEIGEELGVNYILEGSVRKSGTSIRITAQLVRSENGFQMWSETYNRKYTAENIFNIYDEISNKVLHELELTLSPKVQLSKSLPTESSIAYNYFLKATQLEATRLPKDLEGAIENYKKAIENDSKFSLAYARLAKAYYLLGNLGNINQEKSLELMNENIQKALIIDPEEPYAYTAIAVIQHNSGNYRQAIEASEKAISLNPNFAEAHAQLYDYLYFHGRLEERQQAQKHLDKALELEPRSPTILISIATAFYINDNFDKALEFVNKAINEAPAYTASYTLRANIYEYLGTLDKAFISLHAAYLQDSTNFSLLSDLCEIALDLNMVNFARFINNKTVELYPENSFVFLNGVEIELLAGNYEKALTILSNNSNSRPKSEKESIFSYYIDLYNLLDKTDDAVRIINEFYPELVDDHIILNDETILMVFEVSYMFEKAGLHAQADKIRKAFYKELPKGEFNLTDSSSWWEESFYYIDLSLDEDNDELLQLFRSEYFDQNYKMGVYREKLGILGQSLKKTSNYKLLIDDIDKDIGKMRATVVRYLKELQMWDAEWKD